MRSNKPLSNFEGAKICNSKREMIDPRYDHQGNRSVIVWPLPLSSMQHATNDGGTPAVLYVSILQEQDCLKFMLSCQTEFHPNGMP
jgi:hypothetical protein